MTEQTYWRKCGSCKKEIAFNTIYQACNVSTCRKLVFCSVDCWNLHNPVMNHKNSWAEENKSPRKEDYKLESDNDAPRRIMINTRSAESASSATGSANEEDVLIVASKLKQYVKDKYDMNTSANVMEALSNFVRRQTDRAVAKARSEGRKTLMDRDFE
jgi:hypothetical protein